MNACAISLLEILKYTIPAIVVLLAAKLIVEKFVTNETERKRLAIFGDNVKITIPMRMQAYERLALLCERINPFGMLNKFYTKDATVAQLQMAMTETIRTEYEYNLSQQIYVSREAWQTIKMMKEQQISLINTLAKDLNATAPARELFDKMNNYLLNDETRQPNDLALDIINEEAKRVLNSYS
jgi:Fe-S cluster biosynthesis and repair protein YggX